MATVQFSGLVNNIKGKLGGAVFQKCGQLQSLRQYVHNRQPNSAGAVAARKKFFDLARLWSTLDQSLRNEYETYANTYPTKDSYGNNIVLNGYQFFILINSYFQKVASGIVQPVIAYIPPVTYQYYMGAWRMTVHNIVYYANQQIPTDNFLLLYVSKQYRQQANITHRKYTYVGYIDDQIAPGAFAAANLNVAFFDDAKAYDIYWYFIRVFDVSTGCWVDMPESYFTTTT